MEPAIYDKIGEGYARVRRPDPAVAAALHDALGAARTVVNVGAGTGSYEPADRHVVAIEPSAVMVAQRPPSAVPAILARAEALPLADDAVDAAMAILTIHHWSDREAGVRELRRVSRGPVVILTFDPAVSARMWLAAEYLPEVVERDRREFPPIDRLVRWLGGRAGVRALPVARDTPDHTFAAFWAHPERVLDPAARAATSGWARTDPAVARAAVERLRADLASGAWDARHGRLRGQDAYDAGLRLVIAAP